VIGDLNVDIIVTGTPQLPILGHEIPCKDIRTVMGGSAAIFASRLGQLGARVDILGVVGNDENGKIVLKNLASSNVGIEKVKIADTIKTGITLSLSYPKNKAQITFMGSIGALSPSDINPQIFEGYDHLHMSSIYLQRNLLASLPKTFSEAKQCGVSTSLDTNPDPLNKYDYIDNLLRHVDIFLPNDKEAMDITKSTTVDDALEKLSSKVPVVVIKCGEDGAKGRHKSRTARVNPIKIKPVDTTGAGDSFDAGFIYYFLHKKKDFEISMRFANALGALSCLYIGGAEERITETDVLNFSTSYP